MEQIIIIVEYSMYHGDRFMAIESHHLSRSAFSFELSKSEADS